MVSVIRVTTALVLDKGEAATLAVELIICLGFELLTVCWMRCEERECRSEQGDRICGHCQFMNGKLPIDRHISPIGHGTSGRSFAERDSLMCK